MRRCLFVLPPTRPIFKFKKGRRMANSTNFLPSREADLVTWSTNFNTKIVAAPTTYGLTAAQATAYTALHNAWTSAYQTANANSTRTPSSITAKNQEKVNLIDGVGGIRA